MKKQVWKWLGLVLLFVASAFGIWKTIYLSADIDESYAVTLGIRLISGDHLFKDMWEVHQTSAVLYAPFLALYQWLTKGTEGILVYLRIVGIVIQAAVSVYGVHVMKKWVSPAFAVFLSLLYFNFTPKQIQSPEFTQFLYWGIMVLGLSLLQYRMNKKKLHLVVAALSLCVCVLAYPYGIILFPVCIGVLLYKNEDEKKEKIRMTGIFTGTCVVMGVLFLLYVLSGVPFDEFMANISCVLMDESHEQSLKEMWLGHLQSLGEMLIPTFVVILLAQVVLRTGKKASDKKKELTLAGAFLIQTGVFVYQFHTITKVNFTIFLPLILQLAVFLLYVHWILTRDDVLVELEETEIAPNENRLQVESVLAEDVLAEAEQPEYVLTVRENKMIFATMGVPSLAAFVIVLSSSNLSANYSTGFLVPLVLAFVMILVREITTKETETSETKTGEVITRETGEKVYRFLAVSIGILIGVFAVLLLTTRVFLVRFTSTQRKNIFEAYYETNHGPLKGIRLGDTDYRQYEAKTLLLSSLVTEDDVFLYVGCDMFLYSQFQGTIGTGNTISTPVFGEQLMTYYEKYPEKIPDVFFVDREYVADFSSVLQEEPFASFVAANYMLDTSYEGAPVSVYRRVNDINNCETCKLCKFHIQFKQYLGCGAGEHL